MALVPTQIFSNIEQNRRYEDYESLKQYFRNHDIEEFIVRGSQLSTATLAELTPDGAQAYTYKSAEAVGFVKSEADLAALDGDSLWMDYLGDDGTVYSVETKLDSATATNTIIPIGCESGTKVDTVASVSGDTLTMTGLNSSTANDLAGEYVVGVSGDQAGTVLTIASNTAASPTVITCTTTPNANWAADVVSVQAHNPSNFYRVRKGYVETEAPTDNRWVVCDDDGDEIYAQVSDGNTILEVARYFVPKATSGQPTRYFLGSIKASGISHALTGDDEEQGYYVAVTFTPKARHATRYTPSDITITYPFHTNLDVEPCIELEPATDVLIKFSKVLDANHEKVYLEYTFLEVDRLT